MPKPKKDKKSKDTKSFQTKVIPYTVEVTQALTALQLLDSPEEQIVFLSTCTLDTFITTYGKIALTYLQEQDLLRKLFNNLQRCQQIRMICLKLIAKLLLLEEILPKIQKNNEYIVALINVFMTEEKWTNMQNEALSSIFNCVKYNNLQTKLIESKNFLKFCHIGRENGPEHALGFLELTNALIVEKTNRQIMLELRIHDHLHEYCKFDDDLVAVKFCKAVAIFCENCYVIKELANEKIIREIERLMRKAELPWIPYRQAGIHPLFLFLMNNPRNGILFFKTNILKHILEALQHRNEIDTLNYKMVLEMFQSMLCSKCLHGYLWNKEVYTQFVQLLTDSDSEFIKIAITVLKRTLYSQQYRDWFLECNGVEGLSKMICKRDCNYIDEAIGFCKFAAKYDEISVRLLREGLIPVFQDLGSSSIRQKLICESIVDDIYKCELSIKFHDTGFLNYQDITQNGFCFYVGYKPRTFPPEEVDERDDFNKFSFTSTLITVNFHGKMREKIPAALAVHQQNIENDENSSVTSVDVDCPAEVKFVYKLNLPIPDNNPTTDYHLKSYLRKLKILLNDPNNDSISKKINTLAKFVAICLSGYEGNVPTKHHYETHIFELKKKLNSNHIPLGAMRIGGMVERAVLFKVLADRLSIPCTLRRSGSSAFNEVAVLNDSAFCGSPHIRHNFLQECVVDLVQDIGALLLKGQRNTDLYCAMSENYTNNAHHAFQIYHSCDESQSSVE